MLYCPNYNCQAPNVETHHFCERCRTRLCKRYLWAVGNDVHSISVGQYLGDRYLCKAPNIFLDTRPALAPNTIDPIPKSALPYVKLNAYQLHVPQAYGWSHQFGENSADSSPILLLERAAIALPAHSRVVSGAGASDQFTDTKLIQILPAIENQWAGASAIRQLNWLWQIAKLWQPLASEGVVSTLLHPDLIRIEESFVRLLELRSDQRQTQGVGASLFNQLGSLWMQWLPKSQPVLQPFLRALIQHLIEGNIRHPGQLVACLDRALTVAGQVQSRQIQLASQTDQGPSRPRNEDACYPFQPGTIYLNSKKGRKTETQLESSLVMVCDGIGGHLGGAVASKLAIDEIYHHFQEVSLGHTTPLSLITELRKATCTANDVISARNDEEERRERERMGTTLVMGLVQNHELYITHLGDSRAYIVTTSGCHQVTLDDDVASREARLGYGTYRSALAHTGSGSLVQALGMGPSGSLHPTVQRFILDGSGVMVLCSDGLSDNDLIEALWQREILPLLDSDVKDASHTVNALVNAANQYNGHDNVTVSIICWTTQDSSQFKLDANLATPPTLTSSIPALSEQTRLQSTTHSAANTAIQSYPESPTKLISPDIEQSVPSTVSKISSMNLRSLASLIFGLVFILGLGGVFAYLLLPSVSDRIDNWFGFNKDVYSEPSAPTNINSPPSSDNSPENSGDSTLSSDDSFPPLQIGSFIQIIRTDEQSVDSDASQSVLMLLPEPTFESVKGDDPKIDSISQSTESELVQNSEPHQPTSSNESTSSNTGNTITTPIPLVSGTILRMIGQQEGARTIRWVRLRVCHVPLAPTESIISGETNESIPAVAPSEAELNSGNIGWITEKQLLAASEINPDIEPSQLGICQPGTVTP